MQENSIGNETVVQTEVNQMLTLSTAHITEGACMLLEADSLPLIVYPKDVYGFFIVVPEEDEIADEKLSIPECLLDILAFAEKQGVDWIMLDCDAEPLYDLPIYDW
ncbi:hypothetical protein [Paenibacillus alvei]|uniref:DUF5983 family protein n=1 Tax=Paenibacillus alvei TaxID=44250 RepID=UPI0022810B28|nr:hypothetical protein [Paenibacillus alvei]